MARLVYIAATVAALVFAASAAGSPVLLYDNGHVTRVDDPALPPADVTNAGLDAPRACGIAAQAPVASAAAVSVRKALRRAYDRGDIDRDTYSGYGDVYSAAKSAWH